MQPESGTNGRHGAALAVALLVHALFIWALLHVPVRPPHPAALERITLLYLPPPEQMAPEASERRRSIAGPGFDHPTCPARPL
jgi:hypothetical protein